MIKLILKTIVDEYNFNLKELKIVVNNYEFNFKNLLEKIILEHRSKCIEISNMVDGEDA